MGALLWTLQLLAVALCAAALSGCAGNGTPPPDEPAESPGRPRTPERADERVRMVERQIAARGVRDLRVLQAMRVVPRHWFVPPEIQRAAYDDRALPIGAGQTISQPYIVALMTEALALQPGARVLEIGTGSGYQAAVLSELAAEVYTIEIVPELAARAEEALRRHGYPNVSVRAGDGFHGWPEKAPFDAVIVTAAPGHVPEPLLEQLKPGGTLCIPVGAHPDDQNLWKITKQPDGSTHREYLVPVRFVPMTGEVESRR